MKKKQIVQSLIENTGIAEECFTLDIHLIEEQPILSEIFKRNENQISNFRINALNYSGPMQKTPYEPISLIVPIKALI